MDTEFTITSGTYTITASVDHRARAATLFATATDLRADEHATTPPDWESVHLAVESHFRCWINGPIDYQWSPTETRGKAMLMAYLSEKQPTHRIVFTDTSGAQNVNLVRYDRANWCAYTRQEWDDAAMPSWRVSGLQWSRWDGQKLDVEVEAL